MKHRIVILGAGYAGASAAGRLTRRLHGDDVEITLVNVEPDFVERIRMHQLATGQQLRPRPLHDLLAGTDATLRVARVAAVDVDRRTVSLTGLNGTDDTQVLDYDTLVYALGSGVVDGGVQGVTEYAYELASGPGARRLRERLAALADGARVVVVGGGLTGIEAASEIAESFADLHISLAVRGGLGDRLSPAGQRHLRRAFERLGVTVHEHTRVDEVGADSVTTEHGTRIDAEVTVWTAGFAAHPIAADSTLTVSDHGRIVVDRTMRSFSHPDVYAIGDAALAHGPKDNPLRMSCASGMPMAWQAADSIIARLTGGRLPNYPLGYVHQCISLGRRDGIIQLVTIDDRARSIAVGGRLAAWYKEFICWAAALGTAQPVPYPAPRRRLTTPDPSPGRSETVEK